MVSILSDLLSEVVERLRPIKRIKVKDIIVFSTALFKVRYDSLYKAKLFKPSNRVFLRLSYGYTLPNVTNRKLSY